MRTIKFRAKHITKGEWLYGSHYDDNGEEYILPNLPGSAVDYEDYQVDPNTVGQFADLFDKDGNEIYEGDIIECGPRRYVCEFIEGGFEFRDLSDGRLILKAIVIHSHVIGNLHDNPELRLN